MGITLGQILASGGACQSEEDNFVELFFLLQPVDAALQVGGEVAIVALL